MENRLHTCEICGEQKQIVNLTHFICKDCCSDQYPIELKTLKETINGVNGALAQTKIGGIDIRVEFHFDALLKDNRDWDFYIWYDQKGLNAGGFSWAKEFNDLAMDIEGAFVLNANPDDPFLVDLPLWSLVPAVGKEDGRVSIHP